ncbi:desmocollin 2-like protein [Corythoichthys intestinalis]|uniref:desmocollin 2-like protein n=1 Tax=Corythoichthys intestinalis TaxID=161448 RepID=UPI0025A4DA0C|nr:desmocollin 2-like protein [Corythoichthys intestinalis]XP_061795703.1 desmocollin 2-like protein [Nerophis lumbriciformis]
MANAVIFNVCLALILAGVESCFVPSLIYVPVPQYIPAGYEITRVNVASCESVTSNDSAFRVWSNGSVTAKRNVEVLAKGRTFFVLVERRDGQQMQMNVELIANPLMSRKPNEVLQRFKRRWSPPPFNILENDPGPYPRDIERLVSDTEAVHRVYYTLTGPGYDKHPVGVFRFDSDSGMLTVLKPVDREEYPQFALIARVFDRTTRKETDDPLGVFVNVDDQNDNAPQFQGQLQFSVLEKSKVGTIIGKVNATDRDQPGTDHVKIRYSLLSELGQFAIHPTTGVITTATNTLDREVKDKYSVIMQIKDMDGAANGLFTTGTATITLNDINDNPPTFTQELYQATANENEINKLILRIPVEDKDLKDTPNWSSKFIVTKGNENGNFRMETDPKTNEGLLYVSKPLNFEKTPKMRLEIMARNEPELTGTTAKWQIVPVDLAVRDIDEGPEFTAPTIRLKVKENTPNGTSIGIYKAIDPETKSSDGIKYYKVMDPAGWINVDRNTGELRVANTIDRESHFVKDDIYNISMRAVDATSKTGTGTVIIQVEDVNDNVPIIPPAERVVCEKEGELGSTLLVAEDADEAPFKGPFTFSLPNSEDGKWSLTRFNDTAATLNQLKDLPLKVHHVPVEVKDLQGNGKIQTVNVRLCQCRNGACLTKPWSASLGPLGWLAFLLPLLLLLLLLLLLVCFCTTKPELQILEDTTDSGGILIKSNTEAPGEEVDASLIKVPISDIKGSEVNQDWQIKGSTIGRQDTSIYKTGFGATETEFFTGQYDSQYGTQRFNGGMNYDANFLNTWQTNGRYLHQKLTYFGGEEDGRYADDIIHQYGFEGVGSAAGSVGCCSDDGGNNDNLDFLNTLGPKFKNLAAVSKQT